MRVEIEHLPQSQVQLQIEIDPEMLGRAVDKAYQRLAGRYTVPGFRPGKAPRAVLERQLGPEIVLSEAADICMNDAYAQAVKDHNLQPLGYPNVESPKGDEIQTGKPLTFTATIYVRPQVALGDYHALRLPRPNPVVGDDDVERVLESYRAEQAPWEVADGAAEAGDQTTLRLIATIADETLVDQDAWAYQLNDEESPNLPIPGLSAQIIGMTMGEVKDVVIDLPAEYQPAEYAGQQMAMHIEVLRLERRRKPALDDEFAKTLGGFESLAQVREALRSTMQEQATRQADEGFTQEVIRRVAAQASAAVPPPLVDQEVDDMMRQLQENVERERKISMDTYTRIVGKTVEGLREEARPAAEERVRVELVLDAIADAEQLQAPAEEIEDQVRVVAGSATLSSKERRRLLASDDLRGRIGRRLRRRSAIILLEQIADPTIPGIAHVHDHGDAHDHDHEHEHEHGHEGGEGAHGDGGQAALGAAELAEATPPGEAVGTPEATAGEAAQQQDHSAEQRNEQEG